MATEADQPPSYSATQWPVSKVRAKFVDYFVKKQEHINYKSSPVVPVNDPTLLFANAGMNQFKPIFIGTVDPSSPLAGLRRAVNSQKCIRAGGKHNDLDDVGKDTYHHTFFEMLGTWSFGNYFKKDAINWAFDILVNEYKLPKERLYASYFGGDEAMGLPCDTEARDLWLQFLPPERVLPFDKKANFWEMGDTGPCGPCSEIHFDRIGGRDASALVNADDPDVIEIWNLVFIQYNREPSGELRPLPDKHIDTGMGLERLTSILQDKRSNYDTDAFMPIFAAIQKVIGCAPYTGKLGAEDAKQNYRDMAYRVVADHIRTLTMAISDGAVPSNEGRGYVLRRILRRAVRYGMQTLGAKPGFFSSLVPVVAASLGPAFPEVLERTAHVSAVLAEEEQAFSSLLERGVKYFNDLGKELKASGKRLVPGDKAFFLYDSLGFPIDLTQIMASEQGLEVDLQGFQAAMSEQKDRSRSAGKAKRLDGRAALTLGAEQTSYLQKDRALCATNDAPKYTWDQTLSTVVDALYTSKGFVDGALLADIDVIGVIMRDTPFYHEAGGQSPDEGSITIGGVLLDVIDVQSYAGYVVHTCVAAEGFSLRNLPEITAGLEAVAQVDYGVRRRVAPNHTMTHVLNFALRKVLGGEVEQKGSSVNEEKFRFDFSTSRAMTADEVVEVESIVNAAIAGALDVHNEVVPLKEALAINGLRAVFGEVYPDPVRVVSVGAKVADLRSDPDNDSWLGHSIEFCGGTHVSNTKDALAFVITEETAVAKGVRRVSGITGEDAKAALARAVSIEGEVSSIASAIKNSGAVSTADAEERVNALRAQLEESSVSVASKSKLRAVLEGCQKELAAAKNRELIAMVDKNIQKVRDEAIATSKRGDRTAVFSLDIGSDAKAIKRAMEEIKRVAADLSFLCISCEQDKVTVFSIVTDEAQKGGLKASEWVASAVTAAGGRGGGKPGMAQGSAADPAQLQLITQEAARFVSK